MTIFPTTNPFVPQSNPILDAFRQFRAKVQPPQAEATPGVVPEAGMTPDQIARQRAVAEAMLERGTSTAPVGHWTQGVARVMDAWSGGRKERAAGEAEVANADASRGVIEALLGQSAQGAAASSMGAPGMGAAPAGFTLPQGDQSAARTPMEGVEGRIYSGLIERGLPEHVAQGIMMNFRDESGFDPGINEANPIVPGSRGGFGLAQWTGPRRTGFEQFATQSGRELNDIDAQLDWLMAEASGPEKSAFERVMAAGTPGDAAAAFATHFLRPSQEHLDRRVAQYTGGAGYTPAQAAPMMNDATRAAVVTALSDPRMSPEARAVATAMLQQQMQQQQRDSDPMRALELERAQLQLEALRNPPVDPFAGTQVINNQLVGMGPEGPNTLGDFRTAETGFTQLSPEDAAARGLDPSKGWQVGGDGKIHEIGGAGVNVTVGGRQDPMWGDAPANEVWLRDAEGTVITERDPSGRGVRPISTPIAGGPADRDILNQEAEAQAEAIKSVDTADGMISTIDGVLSDPALESATGFWSWTQAIPGTEAYRFGTRVRQLQGQAFLQAFQSLKGGGQITEIEGQKATEAIGRLDSAQKASDYRDALTELREILNGAAERNRARAGVSPDGRTAPVMPSPTGERPTSRAEYDALPSGAEFIAPDGSRRRKP